MGLVYECIDEQISRRVAVKKLLAEYASNSDLATRFFNEALAVNLVSHPSVVQISEILTDPDGSIYLVMEFLAGETLSQRLTRRGGRLSETETLHILWQLASALDATHRLGIVHRDPGRNHKLCSHPGHKATWRRRTDDTALLFIHKQPPSAPNNHEPRVKAQPTSERMDDVWIKNR